MSLRPFGLAASLAIACVLWSPPGWSQLPVNWQGSHERSARSADAPSDGAEARRAQERRDAWMLSVETVTHAPLDWGLALGLETPPGLRVSGGVGWVPSGYMGILTGVAASASGNGYAAAVLEHAEYEGRTWRVQVGFRPFRKIGLYADVGYARVHAEGELALEETGVAMLEALGGGYEATTKLDMWLVELGYQGQVAQRLVLGVGLGAMGTWNSRTQLVAVDGAPRNSALLGSIASDTDAALEKYGFIPTLTLRLGFDLI